MPEQIVRPRYHQGQFLRPDDLVTEQAYHTGMRRRHNIAHHTWGILHGLAVARGVDGLPEVGPGVAVDGYGRELVLTDPVPLPPALFVEHDADALDVWLVYGRVGTDAPPSGYDGCGPDADELYRWRERARLLVTAGEGDEPRPRAVPPQVVATDRDFGPTRTPPDDPDRLWPVFLGRLRRDPADPAAPATIEQTNRPYAGLVGQQVTTPSGRTVVELGAADGGTEPRFTVTALTPQPGGDPLRDELLVLTETELTVTTDATVTAGLTVAGPLGLAPLATPPAPDGWRVYTTDATDENGNAVVEMRIEMPPGGGTNRVTVGAFSPDAGAFAPGLVVDDQGGVTVAGALHVDGPIDAEGFVPPPLLPEAAAALAAARTSGVAAAGALVPGLYRRFPEDPADAATLLAAVAVDTQRLAAIGAALRAEHPEAADAWREALADGDG